jgi:hypothetical protein
MNSKAHALYLQELPKNYFDYQTPLVIIKLCRNNAGFYAHSMVVIAFDLWKKGNGNNDVFQIAMQAKSTSPQ